MTATRTATPSVTSTSTRTPTPTVTPTAVAVVDHYKCYKSAEGGGHDGVRRAHRQPRRRDRNEGHAGDQDDGVLQRRRQGRAGHPGSERPPAVLPDQGRARASALRLQHGRRRERVRGESATADAQEGEAPVRLRRSGRRPAVASTSTRFKCYSAKTPSGSPKFAPGMRDLLDAFEHKHATVLSPESVCNSADMDDHGTISPAAELHCYKIRQAPGQAAFDKVDVQAANTFGTESLRTQKGSLLCVPTTRVEPRKCGDGFRDPNEQCDDNSRSRVTAATSSAVSRRAGTASSTAASSATTAPPTAPTSAARWSVSASTPMATDVCTRDDVCPADTDNDSDGDGYCVGTVFRPPAIGTDDPCSRQTGGTWIKPKVTFTKLDLRAGHAEAEDHGRLPDSDGRRTGGAAGAWRAPPRPRSDRRASCSTSTFREASTRRRRRSVGRSATRQVQLSRQDGAARPRTASRRSPSPTSRRRCRGCSRS